jgi:SAM-dependent methyltransferase
MDEADDTEARLERERSFHDERFALDTRAHIDRLYGTESNGQAAYHAWIEAIPPGSRVLEYGCGTGSAAFGLAARQIEVVGIDISPVAIEEATRSAASQGLTMASFSVMDAEALTFEDGSFSHVCGSGVLHHLDLDRALGRLARVLEPGGTACFFEPMGHNPAVNLFRRLTPKMRTVDEHPLRMDDFELARRHFERVHTSFFQLASLMALTLGDRSAGRWLRPRLERADAWLFARSELARRWSWIVVIELGSPRVG